MTRILVPLDDAFTNARVLELAATMANGIHASVTLLHVFASDVAAERAVGDVLLASAEATLKRAGVWQVTSLVERAPSAHYAIVLHARAHDLIVMGTHGRRGVDHALYGCVAEHVVRDAPCPVVTIHL